MNKKEKFILSGIAIIAMLIMVVFLFVDYGGKNRAAMVKVAWDAKLINNQKSKVNQDIINKIKTQRTALNVFSWDTNYGRIYAAQCSGAPHDLVNFLEKFDKTLEYICMDGGTDYYDYMGNDIANCGGMPLWENYKDDPVCEFLENLQAADSDYYYLPDFHIESTIIK